MTVFNFYDTCSLLLKADYLFENDENIVISSITLEELENIKTSASKSPDVKAAARKVTRALELNNKKYILEVYYSSYEKDITKLNLPVTNDTKILACAKRFAATHKHDIMYFVTNDLACKHLAKLFIDDSYITSFYEAPYTYEGFEEVQLDDEEMAQFYSDMNKNWFHLLINQYLLIYNSDNECVDFLCWTGTTHRKISYDMFHSSYLGKVNPMKGDPYQRLLADSLCNNKITMVKGRAGSGKSYLSLAYLLHQLDHGKLDKIIIFCNTIATKGSAKLGFYPGTRDEKLLDSQIGNMLASKLGDKIAVEQMIQQGKLLLLPMSDIRGFDTNGMKAGVYITEAQNLDINLIKLALQRIGEDSVCIIDGDFDQQVDDIAFAGSNNGMRRVSKVFRGEDIYGEITLRKIHRSRIANIADKL